jgi:8-oxo-dGTP pyrophosphatase MutT (NUDIX family)
MRYSWDKFLNVNTEQAAGIVVCFNEQNHILILRRSSIDGRDGQWTVPGGHIDDEDTSIEAGAVRELKEEAGLICNIDDLIYLGEPKPQKYYFIAKRWSGKLKIDIPNPKTGEIEHDDYKWATINEMKDIDNSEIPIYLLEEAIEIIKNKSDY